MKNNKKIKTAVIISVILLALVSVFVFTRTKPAKVNQSAQTYTVTKEIVQNVIEISGTVEAAESQNLQAAGDGQVMAVYASQGDFVKKGQVLVELDTTQQEYEIAKLDYDIAQTKITGNAKELELKNIQRKSLVKKLEDRKIIASFSGILADFDVSVGEYLEAKDSVGTLVERSYLKSYVEVVETDAPKLAANQIVYCSFPAYPDNMVSGYVVSYPQVGTVTSRGASVVKAEIRIDNPPEIILPNYSFTGEIEISPPETLLLVEKEAVGFNGKQTFVERIKKDGSKEQLQVVIEPYGLTHVRILSGNIAEGDVLAALAAPPVSGTRPVTKNSSDKNGQQNPNGFSAFPGMGAGMPGVMPPKR